jgi:Protein of unknown function (DUF3039)
VNKPIETHPSPRPSNDGEWPIFNHYHRKYDITRAIVTGEKILALCGLAITVRARGNGSVAQRTAGVYLVCEPCKQAFEALRTD